MGSIIEFLPLIVLAFAGTNYLLSKKPARMPSSQRRTKTSHVDAFDQEVHEARKIRKVDMVTFTSHSIPREQTRERVIKYQVASWEVRGHVRHYKDGRTTYVKPHTSYRKCIDGAESKAPAQKSIIVKKQ